MLAKETGTDGPHERLFQDNIVIREPGYIYIYLSNEETENPAEVFFDDFSVEHIKGPVVQVDEYYPFGLGFNSYRRENSIKNQFQYNGKELQDELDIGWNDYGSRMYMSEIGRFFTQDPRATEFGSWSPYLYAANNPVRLVDVDGEGPGDPIKIIFTANVNRDMVSGHSIRVIERIAKQAGVSTIMVTSSYRTKEHQMEVMYANLQKPNGVAQQRETYGKAGEAVIDEYVKAIAEKGATPESVKAAMLKKSEEVGFISPHSSESYYAINAIDISYKGFSEAEYQNLRAAAKGDNDIFRVFGKEEGDNALHIEVLQQQPMALDASQGSDPLHKAFKNIKNARSLDEMRHWSEVFNKIKDGEDENEKE